MRIDPEDAGYTNPAIATIWREGIFIVSGFRIGTLLFPLLGRWILGFVSSILCAPFRICIFEFSRANDINRLTIRHISEQEAKDDASQKICMSWTYTQVDRSAKMDKKASDTTFQLKE